MSATSRSVAGGIVIGLASALLGQQLGYVDLGPTFAWVNLIVFAFVGAVVFGMIGRHLGRPRGPTAVRAWTPTHEDAAAEPEAADAKA